MGSPPLRVTCRTTLRAEAVAVLVAVAVVCWEAGAAPDGLGLFRRWVVLAKLLDLCEHNDEATDERQLCDGVSNPVV